MQNDFYQVSLKLILKNTNNEILILKSDSKGSYAGFYDLPGGRINVDEFTTPIEEIIRREVREELGNIDFKSNFKPVSIGRHLLPASMNKSGQDLHILYIFFEGEMIDGHVSISNEHEGFQWFDFKDKDLNTYFKSGTLEGLEMWSKNKSDL